MGPNGQSALWARVTGELPTIPTPDMLRMALNRAEHERAKLAQGVRELAAETEAWHHDAQAQREDLLRLQAQVAVISRRLERAVAETEDRQGRQGEALAVLQDSSADLVDAVRSHTARSLHELEQLRDELREASDRSAWRTRLAFVGCLVACALSVAAWSGVQRVATPAPAPVAVAAQVSPVGSTVLAGFKRPK